MTASDTEIELESWMLTFSNDYIVDMEPQIEIEPWMLTFATDIIVEDWMTNTFFWDSIYLLARK